LFNHKIKPCIPGSWFNILVAPHSGTIHVDADNISVSSSSSQVERSLTARVMVQQDFSCVLTPLSKVTANGTTKAFNNVYTAAFQSLLARWPFYRDGCSPTFQPVFRWVWNPYRDKIISDKLWLTLHSGLKLGSALRRWTDSDGLCPCTAAIETSLISLSTVSWPILYGVAQLTFSLALKLKLLAACDCSYRFIWPLQTKSKAIRKLWLLIHSAAFGFPDVALYLIKHHILNTLFGHLQCRASLALFVWRVHQTQLCARLYL
jgi:hypothetical protein